MDLRGCLAEWRTGAWYCLSAALCGTAADVHSSAPGLADFMVIASCVAGTAIGALAVFLALWTAYLPIRLFAKFRPEGFTLGASIFVFQYFAFAPLFDAYAFPVLTEGYPGTAPLLLISASSAIVVYLASATGPNFGTWKAHRVIAMVVASLSLLWLAVSWWRLFPCAADACKSGVAWFVGAVILGTAPWFLRRPSWLQEAVVFSAVFAAGAVGLVSPSAPSIIGQTGPNVVLITIDTLRADSVWDSGGVSNRVRGIKSLAKDGVSFSRAISSGPWTVPGLASVLTGSSPFVHGLSSRSTRLHPDLPTLIDRFAEAGYRTAGVGYNPHLAVMGLDERLDRDQLHPPKHLGDSLGAKALGRLLPRFKTYPSTSDLTQWVVEWLDQNDSGPFFLWIHYFDPHSPYTPPSELVDRDGLEVPSFGFNLSADLAQTIADGRRKADAQERLWIRRLYDAEVLVVDRGVETVLAELRSRGLYEDSVIALTSDHGEEFWEHGLFEHGQSLYDELLHVPMIIKSPRSTDESIYPGLVGTASIAPTLLDLAGVTFNSRSMTSPSLAPLFNGAVLEETPVISTGVRRYDDWVSVTYAGQRYIRRSHADEEQIFDLAVDPAELRPLQAEEQLIHARELLEAHMAAAIEARQVIGLVSLEQSEVDSGTLKILRSLGYIQ